MLVLTVRVGDSIYIDDNTVITVLDRWLDEVDLQIDTDQVITIDDRHLTNSPATNLTPKCQT
ncbi:carbon storage regulator [Zhongshania marina]|uniref:Carbon storage regulator n=1 Tax=Zhongshania marina TaxID=2304603 RepID=A0A2S4HGE5_9GAMM|nr:hypothetical protein C0068_08150 [Marortus luteolus]